MLKLRFLIFAMLPGLMCLGQDTPPAKGSSRELGIADYRSGKLIDAEHAFAAAMAQDPADLESVQMRGLTLYRLGQPAAAIPYLERVRQWMPNANAATTTPAVRLRRNLECALILLRPTC